MMKTCPVCNKPIYQVRGMSKKNIPKYCSSECWNKVRSFLSSETKCGMCKRPFIMRSARQKSRAGKGYPAYCSLACVKARRSEFSKTQPKVGGRWSK